MAISKLARFLDNTIERMVISKTLINVLETRVDCLLRLSEHDRLALHASERARDEAVANYAEERRLRKHTEDKVREMNKELATLRNNQTLGKPGD